jgi:hypothetical protein
MRISSSTSCTIAGTSNSSWFTSPSFSQAAPVLPPGKFLCALLRPGWSGSFDLSNIFNGCPGQVKNISIFI